MHARRGIAAAAALGVTIALAACGGDSEESATERSASGEPAEPIVETRGPSGETGVPTSEITLTEEQIAEIKKGGYTAALLWHTADDVTEAEQRGVESVFDEIGIEVISVANAQYQAERQADQINTVLAQDPDIIIALPVDPVAGASAFRKALDAGVKLVFEANIPQGFKHPDNYVSVVSSDTYEMGRLAAESLAESIGGQGKIAYFFHDADFYLTNQRDEAFKQTIQREYPDIEIVEEQGIADPNRAEEQANAVFAKHGDLDGLYVTFGEPAMGIISALRNVGAGDTKVVTHDIQEPLVIDMAQDGNMDTIILQGLFEDGQTMARAAGLAMLGEETPQFAISPAATMDKESIEEGYRMSLGIGPPESVLETLGK